MTWEGLDTEELGYGTSEDTAPTFEQALPSWLPTSLHSLIVTSWPLGITYQQTLRDAQGLPKDTGL